MGLRGPAPTPQKILDARGSWRGKLPSGEPRPERGAPRCPPHLTGTAAGAVWRSICRQLDAMGVLAKIDAGLVERYCVYLARWRQCEEFLAKNGISYAVRSDDPTCYVGKPAQGAAVVGFMEYPELRESHRLDKALKGIEARFGLSPADRARLTVPDAGADEPEGPRLADFVG